MLKLVEMQQRRQAVRALAAKALHKLNAVRHMSCRLPKHEQPEVLATV